jgi:hypothetical protein
MTFSERVWKCAPPLACFAYRATPLSRCRKAWRESPLPLTVNGNLLPTEFISTVEDIIGHLPTIGTNGYLRSEWRRGHCFGLPLPYFLADSHTTLQNGAVSRKDQNTFVHDACAGAGRGYRAVTVSRLHAGSRNSTPIPGSPGIAPPLSGGSIGEASRFSAVRPRGHGTRFRLFTVIDVHPADTSRVRLDLRQCGVQ